MTDANQDVQWPEFETREATTERKIGFRIDGKAFLCLDEPPASIWTLVQSENNEPGSLVNFVAECIADEIDAERFRQTVRRRDRIADIKVIRDIVVMLVEKYAERPTNPPAESFGGREATGNSSTDVFSRTAPTS